MDAQLLINMLLGLGSFFGGIWIKSIADSMKELKETDMNLANKVQSIEVLVAGEYVKREAFEKAIKAIFVKLDRIEEKLDHKADK